MTHFGSVRAAKQTDSLYRGNLINMNNTSKTNFPLRPRQRMSISMEICMHSCRDLNQFCFKFDPLGRAPCSHKNKKCFRAPPRSFQRGIWAKKTLKNCKLQVSRSGRPLGGPLGNPYRWPGWSRFQRARGKRTGNAKSSGTAVEPLGVDLIFHVFGARRRSRW